MIILGIDPIHHVIVTAAHMPEHDILGVIMSVGGTSHLTENDIASIAISDADFDGLLAQKNIALQAFLDIHDSFLYMNGKLLIRPTTQVTLLSESTMSKAIGGTDALVVPINSVVTIQVAYVDPDNVNLMGGGLTVKTKDRFDFVAMPESVASVDITHAKPSFTFDITSAYPGVCKIRSKDTNYLCQISTLSLRFR
jgi:hypothetical protein